MKINGNMADIPKILRQPKSLPSLPSVACEILRVSRDPHSGLHDIARVVSNDVTLAAKLIKTANTPHYRRGPDVTSLPQAVILLGSSAVKLLSLSFSLVDSLSLVRSERFNLVLFWRRSVSTAVIARGLARAVRAPEGDEAFLCGLLSRIGQLAMISEISDTYANVATPLDSLPTRDNEKSKLGFDFHEVGYAIAESWSLPVLLADVIYHWGDALKKQDFGDASTFRIAQIVQIADQISEMLWASDKGPALRNAYGLALAHFGLAAAEVDALVLSTQKAVSEVASILDIDATHPDEYAAILSDARQQMVDITLMTHLELDQARRLAQDLEDANEQLDVAAKTDTLTQLANRAYFDLHLCEVIEARLHGQSANALGLLMMDIDHFKELNDTYGHLAGDDVLRMVGQCLTNATRNTDFVARYGGEEFVAILPNTSLIDLESVANRLCKMIAKQTTSSQGHAIQVTMSFGGACVSRITSPGDGQALLQLADQCLYEAKDEGRNGYVCRELQLEEARI